MKVEIQAGAKLDILSPDELRDELAKLSGWRTELARGVKFRDITATVTGLPAGPGTYTINKPQDLGPRPGFVWAVPRLAISGDALTIGTDTFSVFKSENSPSRLVQSGIVRGAKYAQYELILTEADSLVIVGAYTGAGATVTVSGSAVELPVQLAWQLL